MTILLPPESKFTTRINISYLHLANEGTFVLATASEFVDQTLNVLRQDHVSRRAAVVGYLQSRRITPVMVVRALGREVALDEPSGMPLPRIC